MPRKPIRVFCTDGIFGPHRFEATQHYKSEVRDGKEYVVITGEKWDVTDDIARAILRYDLEFSRQESHDDAD